MNRKILLASLTSSLFLLSACGGGGGSDPAPVTNTAPSADAGPNQNAQPGMAVTLDGRASSDPDGDNLTYSWTQKSGPLVTLSDASASQPQFNVPAGTGFASIIFELTVNDGSLDSSPDSVEVVVSPPTRVIFDPEAGKNPTPNNWGFEGSTGRTLNVSGDAFMTQMNALDGFSTIAPMAIIFDQDIDPDTLVGGENVRVFEAVIDSDTREVISIQDELQAGTDYVVELSDILVGSAKARIMIKPLVPLKPSTGTGDATGYVVALTNGIRDIYGFPVQTNDVYEAVRGDTDLTGGDLAALENLRQQTVGWTQLLDGYLTNPVLNTSDIVVSFSFTTQSTTDSLEAIAAAANAAGPQPYTVTGLSMHTGGADSADVYDGKLTVPNYLSPYSGTNGGMWLDAPAGKRVTRYNPLPVQNATSEVAFSAALPDSAVTGCTKPPTGWPVVIYDGGGANAASVALVVHFSDNATGASSLATIADDFAERCVASITLDRPRPVDSGLAGTDQWRQKVSNLIYLVQTLSVMDIDGSGADFDANAISFAGHSAGADMGILLAAVEPDVRTIVVSGPDAGIAKALDGSQSRQPSFNSNLPPEYRQGTDVYELILAIIQSTNDVFDPLNYVGKIRPTQAFHLIEVYGGGILPGDIGTGAGSGCTDDQGNFLNPGDVTQPPSVLNEGCNAGQVVETSYLAGTESIARLLGLTHAGSTLGSPSGTDPLKAVTRFTRGHHASNSIEEFNGFGVLGVSEEWRNQQAEFVASGGVYLPVSTSPQAYIRPTEP